MRKLVIIEISPTRLELGVVIGSRIETSRIARFARDDAEDLTAQLARAESMLGGWVEELSLAGRAAGCVYRSDECHASVTSCPVSAGRAGAMGAARLSVGEGVSFAVDQSPLALDILMTDAPSKEEGDAGARQMHTLGVADSEGVVGEVLSMLERVGLKAMWCAPALGVQMIEAVRAANQGGAGRQVAMCIWEEETVLAGSVDGALKFVRTIGIGTESLVAACAQIAPQGEPEDAQQWARQLLFGQGIPDRDVTVDEEFAIRGGQVLARVSPLLQRLGVEMKQSVRFGLGDGPTPTVNITGFGRAIPHLDEVVGEACDCTLESAETDQPGGAEPTSAEVGAINAFAEGRGLKSTFVTKVKDRARGIKRVRQATWFGVGLALLVMGYEYADAGMQLKEVHAKLATLGEVHAEGTGAGDLRDQVVSGSAGVNAARKEMTDAMGECIDTGAVLFALSEATPQEIRLQSINISDASQSATCIVRGLVAGDANEASEMITSYFDALQGLPLVERVRLGTTGRQMVDGREGRRFEMTVDLVRMPPRVLAGLIDGAEGEEQP